MSDFLRMRRRDNSEVCPLCKRGSIVGEDRQLAFRQQTDKGYVFCQLSISVQVCKGCGFTGWDEAAEAAIECAVRGEYERLP
jgi:hypothetical protein